MRATLIQTTPVSLSTISRPFSYSEETRDHNDLYKSQDATLPNRQKDISPIFHVVTTWIAGGLLIVSVAQDYTIRLSSLLQDIMPTNHTVALVIVWQLSILAFAGRGAGKRFEESKRKVSENWKEAIKDLGRSRDNPQPTFHWALLYSKNAGKFSRLKSTCIVTLSYTGLFKLGEEKNVAQANSTLVVLTRSHKFSCWLLGEFYCTKAIPVSEIQHVKENGEQ